LTGNNREFLEAVKQFEKEKAERSVSLLPHHVTEIMLIISEAVVAGTELQIGEDIKEVFSEQFAKLDKLVSEIKNSD